MERRKFTREFKLAGGNPFRARAYVRAVDALAALGALRCASITQTLSHAQVPS